MIEGMDPAATMLPYKSMSRARASTTLDRPASMGTASGLAPSSVAHSSASPPHVPVIQHPPHVMPSSIQRRASHSLDDILQGHDSGPQSDVPVIIKAESVPITVTPLAPLPHPSTRPAPPPKPAPIPVPTTALCSPVGPAPAVKPPEYGRAVALFDFKKRNPDEIDLFENEVVRAPDRDGPFLCSFLTRGRVVWCWTWLAG